jgi:hypothetical protein
MVLKDHGVILVLTNIKRVHPYTQVLWPMRECSVPTLTWGNKVEMCIVAVCGLYFGDNSEKMDPGQNLQKRLIH